MTNTTSVDEPKMTETNDLDRRSFMAYLSVLGIGGAGLWQQAQQEGSIHRRRDCHFRLSVLPVKNGVGSGDLRSQSFSVICG